MYNYVFGNISVRSLILINVFFILSQCSDKRHEISDGDQVILKVGQYNVSLNEFREQVGNASDYQAAPSQLYNQILDSYISAALLIEGAKKEKLDQQDEIARKINLFKVNSFPAFAKSKRLDDNKQAIDKTEVPPELYKTISTFDYVFVPNKQKVIADDLLDRLNSGSSVTELIASNKFNEWSRLKLGFYPDLSTASAIFTRDLLEKVGKIKSGAFQRVRTNSGIHLIKVVNRWQSPYPQQTKNAVAFNLRVAQAIVGGDSLLNPRTLDASLKINDDLFSDIDFEVQPLIPANIKFTDSDPVVGSFLGQDIHENQLIKQIAMLPAKVQSYFRNKSTRSLEITNLILVNNAGVYNRKLQMIKDRSDQLTIFFTSGLRRFGLKDTLSFLVKTIESSLKSSAGAGSDSIRADFQPLASSLFVYETNEVKKTMPIPLFKKGDFSWIYKEDLPGKEMVKLNFEEINKIQFAVKGIQFDNSDIAYCKDWHLTFSDLQSALGQLTPQTRLGVAKNNDLIKLIYYLRDNSQPAKKDNRIFFNQRLLNEVDIIGDALDRVNSYKENDIVGSLANIKLTEVQTRYLISDLPEEDRRQYLTDEYLKKEAFKQLLINEFWKRKVNIKEFEKDAVVNRQLQRYKNWLLSDKFYKSRILVSAPETTNEFLNVQLRMACQVVTEKRLSVFLLKEAALTNIKVNIRLLKAIGGDPVKSGYFFSVINN